eukprot:gb/GFBE01013088.1/.p1 GENE.gb/GFBE01013088.1/~~gb/GFBE01013088.1/.p1  ORF type:complete len:115 (+),score=16.34 gb/GFBE01013088.1/:1-345(+)
MQRACSSCNGCSWHDSLAQCRQCTHYCLACQMDFLTYGPDDYTEMACSLCESGYTYSDCQTCIPACSEGELCIAPNTCEATTGATTSWTLTFDHHHSHERFHNVNGQQLDLHHQ